MVGTGVLSVGALTMAAAGGSPGKALGMMVLGRMVCGLGVGVVSTSVPLYQR